MVVHVRDLFIPQALLTCHRGRHKVPNICSTLYMKLQALQYRIGDGDPTAVIAKIT